MDGKRDDCGLSGVGGHAVSPAQSEWAWQGEAIVLELES